MLQATARVFDQDRDINPAAPSQQPNPWTDDWVTFFREHRLRHQLKLAANSRLNQLAEPLLRPGAMESLFGGIQVKPSVLHGEWQRQVARHPLLYLHDHGSGHRSFQAAERAAYGCLMSTCLFACISWRRRPVERQHCGSGWAAVHL